MYLKYRFVLYSRVHNHYETLQTCYDEVQVTPWPSWRSSHHWNSLIFSRNSEASASESLENIEEVNTNFNSFTWIISSISVNELTLSRRDTQSFVYDLLTTISNEETFTRYFEALASEFLKNHGRNSVHCTTCKVIYVADPSTCLSFDFSDTVVEGKAVPKSLHHLQKRNGTYNVCTLFVRCLHGDVFMFARCLHVHVFYNLCFNVNTRCWYMIYYLSTLKL